jgi:hypothetical protein
MTVGDKIKKVEISQPTGAGDTIGGYHHGQMVFQQGRWRAYLNRNSIVTGDDVQIIIDLLENKKAER